MLCLFAHLDLDSDLLNPDLLNLFLPKPKDSGNLLLSLGPGFGLLLRQDRPASVLMVTQKTIFLAQLSSKLQTCSSTSFLKRKRLGRCFQRHLVHNPSNTELVNMSLLTQSASPQDFLLLNCSSLHPITQNLVLPFHCTAPQSHRILQLLPPKSPPAPPNLLFSHATACTLD